MKSPAFGFTRRNFSKRNLDGFTLIELLVAITILSILMGAVIVGINPTERLEEALDAVRLSDMETIAGTLEQYLVANDRYPPMSTDACCGEWDQGPCGSDLVFIQDLASKGFLKNVPTDPGGGSGSGCYGYAYYYYPAGSEGCALDRGAFYVLGVRDMGSSGVPHPNSPGWSCPSRNWQEEFDWVAGAFESL